MNLESIYKLSVVMNMIDNLSSPMAKINTSVGDSTNKVESMNQAFGASANTGAAIAGVGKEITTAMLAPVEATFDTRRALGELSSLGVKDLQVLENAAKDFSDTWAGTTKADFITAAYDIKSGIASLSDEGVAGFTGIAALTAKATKANASEMTSLFATGYGIYKDYYSNLSDMEFGEIFSAGIADSVRAFKTSGSGMAQSITALGGAATTANVPLEEQLAVLGMLQATMSGSEAGTKYKAFVRSAAKAGKELKLSFLDNNNQLKSMPEILETLKSKYGETLDAIEKQQIQKAFGSDEAVALIDLLYSKTDDLQGNILGLYGSMGQGISVATRMAQAINETEPEKYETLKQKVDNVTESVGNLLLPTIDQYIGKASKFVEKASEWISKHEDLVRTIMLVLMWLGVFLTVGGTTIAVVSGIGLVFSKTIGFVKGFYKAIKAIPSLLETLYIKGLYAGDALKGAFTKIKVGASMAKESIKHVATSVLSFAKTAAINGVNAVKGFVSGMVGMAKQAITTAVTALPPLIASVWSFTAALLANPITWVVIGIIALIAGIVLLYNKCEWFRNAVNGIFSFFKNVLGNIFSFVKNIFGGIGNAIGKVMGAVKDNVREKLGNIKNTFESNGGGIKGAAAVAFEGVKGIFTGGLTFVDNLTGGKLSAIKDKFSNGFSAVKNVVSEKFGAIKESISNKVTAIAGHFTRMKDSIVNGFATFPTKIKEKFVGAINKGKEVITGAFSWFKNSGKKIITTFTDGIKSVISKPVEAVKGGLAKLRKLLPFSDAKEGPLSTLTLSGRRMLETITTGIREREDLPALAVQDSLDKVDFTTTKATISKVKLSDADKEEKESNSQNSKKEKTVIIQKLLMSVDFNNIKELKKLLALLADIEDYSNGSGVETNEEIVMEF